MNSRSNSKGSIGINMNNRRVSLHEKRFRSKSASSALVDMKSNGTGTIQLENTQVIDNVTSTEKPKKLNAEQQHKNVLKLFSYVVKMLPSVPEKNCVRLLDEIYDSEIKYLKLIEQLQEARKYVSELKYHVLCCEDEGPKKCRHRMKRSKCHERSGRFEPLIAEEDLNKMFFKNITNIQMSHKQVVKSLRKSLSRMWENLKRGKSLIVSQIIRIFCAEFTQMAPYWAMYTDYIQRIENCVIIFQKLKAIGAFKTGINRFEEGHGTSMMYLINQPLLRITKYPLLFNSLVKRAQVLVDETKDASQKVEMMELVKNLKKVSIKIRVIVDKVNVKVGRAAEVEQMCKVNVEIGEKLKKTKLLQPFRTLKREMVVSKFHVGADIMINTGAIMFVFNDLIIVATETCNFKKTKLIRGRGRGSSMGSSRAVSRLRRSSNASTVSASSHMLALSSIKSKKEQKTTLQGFKSTSTRSSSRVKRKKKKKNSTRSTLNNSLQRRDSDASGMTHRSNTSSVGGVGKIGKTRKFNSSFLLGDNFRRNDVELLEEEEPRDLTPIAEMKINRLISPIVTKEQIGAAFYFVMTFTYDETADVELPVKFFFKSAQECQDFKLLFKKLQKEFIDLELKHQNVIKKFRQPSVVTVSSKTMRTLKRPKKKNRFNFTLKRGTKTMKKTKSKGTMKRGKLENALKGSKSNSLRRIKKGSKTLKRKKPRKVSSG